MPCLPKLEPASTVLPGRRATAGGLSGRVLLTLHPGSPDSPRSPISVGIVAKARKIIFGAALSPPGKEGKLC